VSEGGITPLKESLTVRLFRKRPVFAAALVLAAITVFLVSAKGQVGVPNILSYDSANNWMLFTDRTGTWHAPLAIHNAAAPANSVVEFTVNTDDQFMIQTYNQSRPASSLDLDTDGSASLYGSGGGGVGVEAASGDTCIPAVQTNPCGPVALRIGANGIVNHYRGQATAGNGISTIQYYADASLTGNFGPYTIFTTNASGYASSGLYRLSGYMTATSAQSGGSMQLVLGYADETGIQTQYAGQPNFGAVGANLPFSLVFYSQAGQPITIATVTTGGPTYTIHLRLEAL